MITHEIVEQYKRLIVHLEGQRYALAVKKGLEIAYPHQKDYLTEFDLEASIRGDRSVGIMLAQDKTSLVKAGAIDIDCPRDALDLVEGLALAKRLQQTALKFDLRGYIEFSGNRGFHLWIFAEKPVNGALMQDCLKAIAKEAGFDCKEYFPNAIPESKCIKLPGVIHLKSGKRCGFITSDFDPTNPLIHLEKQAELMAGFFQNPVADLAAAANLASEKPSPQSHSSNLADKLNQFISSHPSCIDHLTTQGAPLNLDYNQSNLSLVRYCISRGFNQDEAIALAEKMAANTSADHPTSKNYQGKISNFKSAFNSASRNRDDYQFQCSYILANLGGQPLSSRGCIGAKCSLCDWAKGNDNISSEPTKLPLNSLIFQALLNLYSQGKERCKSLILAEVEKMLPNISGKEADTIPDSVGLREAEVLAYLINSPDRIADHLEIFAEGFVAVTTKPLPQYLDYLLNLELPNEEDTIEEHVDLIREEGLKVIACTKLNQFIKDIEGAESSVGVIDKVIDESEELLKQSLSDKQLLRVSDRLASWVEELLSADKISIPTFSNDLNYLLNGGLSKGRLYVLGAPPANGKSTLAAQLGDVAASQGFRICYASYEMSAEHLFLASLSRLGRINSSLLEGKKYLADERLKLDFFQAIKDYQQKVAANIHIIEADDSYTPSRLLGVIKKVSCDLLIVDYLQLLSSGDEKLDASAQEVLRVSKIATELKRLARKTNIPVIAISDVNKNAYSASQKGGSLDLASLRDSFKIAHSADCIMLLQSHDVVVKDDIKVNQAYLLADSLKQYNPASAALIHELTNEYRLDKTTSDIYSKLIVAKNRTGRCGEILFRYSKALHRFESMNYLTATVNLGG